VGQISFFDFVSSVNLNDDRENEGNVNLVPPQSWEGEVEAVFRLGAYGSTTLRTYYHAVEDVIDVIPIGIDGEGIGNIDSATRYGVDWRSTLTFDPYGWRGARLDFRFIVQETELEDPLTGELRPISNSTQRAAEAQFRWDIPSTDWAFGSSASYSHNALSYRLTEVGRQTEGPIFASVFVEHKDVFGLTVRATGRQHLRRAQHLGPLRVSRPPQCYGHRLHRAPRPPDRSDLLVPDPRQVLIRGRWRNGISALRRR
jgi:hypothetical protein